MKTIEALQQELMSICQELEERKNAESKKDISDGGLSEIYNKAQRYPISNHPLCFRDDHIQQMYLLMLLSVADIDKNAYDESLYTVCRIAHGMGYSGDVQELLLKARQINSDMINECTALFSNSELKIILIVECMLVSAHFVDGKRKAMEHIANLGVWLKMEKNEFVFAANFARAVIKEDVTEYRCNLMNDYDCLECYVDILYRYRSENIQIFSVDLPYKAQFSKDSTAGKFYYDYYLYNISISIGSQSIQVKGIYCGATDKNHITNNYNYEGNLLYLDENPKDDYIKEIYENGLDRGKTLFGGSFMCNMMMLYDHSDLKNENTNIPFAFAADSLLLYNRAKKQFIEQGGVIEES